MKMFAIAQLKSQALKFLKIFCDKPRLRINNISWLLLACANIFMSSQAASMPNDEGIQIFQKSVLTPERKQNLTEDLTRYRNADNMWDILRTEFILPHYEDNPLVQEKISWYLNHPDYLMRSATRAAPYLFYIMQQLRKRHLPAELALLPMIESAYNPFEYSSAGAAGIWQLMPATASDYGIKQSWWYDGRRDVVASTKAALNHLAYLGTFFNGNWSLAIAAYDTGEGNVLAAIRRNIRDGMSTDYWQLPFSAETRNYLPQLLALAIIISHPEQYAINFPPVQNAPYLAQIDVGRQIDLKQAAYLAGLSLKKLMQLNPGFTHAATDPTGPYKIVLPMENVEQFTLNLAQSPFYRGINWLHYKIKRGDTLNLIAKHFKTTPYDLRKMNPLLARLKPGDSLVIPHNHPVGITETILTAEAEQTGQRIYSAKTPLFANISRAFSHPRPIPQAKYVLRPGDTLYMVRHGDDIQKIARHFKMDSTVLASVNQLSTHSVLAVGNRMIVPTHLPRSKTRLYQLTPGDTVYVVRNGDTLEKVARRFHTSPATLRLANLLASNSLQEGDRLVIPTHV
jgi:membrane-bound lytic murein transglycosylase D